MVISKILKDFSVSAAIAGLVTILVGFTSAAVIVFQHDLAKFGESGKRDSHRRLKCGMILTAESYSRTTMLPFVGIPPTIQAG
ncbi:MAG: hypothetical protein AAF327_25975, partial [Cyanobacteria bacterium P01_A01_bin.37]